MKKTGIMALLVMCIISMTACEKKDKEAFSGQSIAEEGLKTEKPQGLEILKDKEFFSSVTENQEYQMETDQQYWFSDNFSKLDCAETKQSYYFLADAKLYVFDKETKKYAVLCNKPSCTHEYNSDCNAILNNGWGQCLEYYNGFLYALGSKTAIEETTNLQKEYIVLYRISLDGSKVDEVMNIAGVMKTAGVEDNIFTFYSAVIHRGYLYYIYNYGTGMVKDSYYVNNSHTIYRVSLDGSQAPECICPMEFGNSAMSVSIQGHGSYVYFIQMNEEVMEGGYLYRLNTETKKLEYIDIGGVSFYQIVGDRIVYFKSPQQKYYYCDLKTWETGILYERAEDDPLTLGYIVWDGMHLNIKRFSDEEAKIILYKENLEKVAEYDTKDIDLYEIISHDYTFYISNDGIELYYLDKSKIEEGTMELVQAELIQ